MHMIEKDQNKINFMVISPNVGNRCTIHNLENIIDFKILNSRHPENIFTSNISSFAYFAPGPLYKKEANMVLYVGYTKEDNHNMVSSLSSRNEIINSNGHEIKILNFSPNNSNLKKFKNKFNNENFDLNFIYTYNDGFSFTGINVAPHFEQYLHTKYIYGFSFKGFSYFLTLQNKSDNSGSPGKSFQTRLVRVCQNDLSFYSYTEIPLTCFYGNDQLEYNLAQTAMFVPHTLYHFQNLHENSTYNTNPDTDWALYIAMSSNYPNFYSDSPNPSLGTALCVYPIQEIVSSFTEAIKRCFEGLGQHIPWIVGVEEGCIKEEKNITDNFCGSAINFPIHTHLDLFAQTSYRFEGIISSLAIHKYKYYSLNNKKMNTNSNLNIAFIGTNTGLIKKVLLTPDTAFTLNSVDLYESSSYQNRRTSKSSPVVDKSIKASNVFSKDNQTIYFLSSNKLFMYPLNSCTLYQNCGECLSLKALKDPLNCGWCKNSRLFPTSNDECTTIYECKGSWIQSHCSPRIDKLYPLSGPEQGFTLVTLEGENFGNIKSSQINATIAGIPCEVISLSMNKIILKTPPYNSHVMQTTSTNLRIHVVDRTLLHFDFNIEGRDTSPPYIYKVISIQDYSPNFGIFSGYNELIVKGQNLDIGSNATITLGRDLHCSILNRSSHQIICRSLPYTSMVHNKGIIQLATQLRALLLDVTLMIDGMSITLNPQFSVKPDPTVVSVEPKSSIMSGGSLIKLKFKGIDPSLSSSLFKHVKLSITIPIDSFRSFFPFSSLDFPLFNRSLRNTEMPILLDRDLESTCQSTDQNSHRIPMHIYSCSAPNVSSFAVSQTFAENVGIKMVDKKMTEAIKKDKNTILITGKINISLFGKEIYMDDYYVYVDPVYHELPSDPLYLNPDKQQLEIKGVHIDLIHTIRDIKIMVGPEECNILKLTSTYISCIPPRLPDSEKTPITKLSAKHDKLSNLNPRYKNDSMYGKTYFSSTISSINIGNKVYKRSPKDLLFHQEFTKEGLPKYKVVVKAGPLIFHLGYVAYSSQPIKSNYVWATLAALSILIFFSIFLILVIWKKKRNKKLKNRYLMHQALETMRYSEANGRCDSRNFDSAYQSTPANNINHYDRPLSPMLLAFPNDSNNRDIIQNHQLERENLLDSETIQLLSDHKSFMIPSKCIILGPLIGSGNFGRVFRAKYCDKEVNHLDKEIEGNLRKESQERSYGEIVVAVKTLNTTILNQESLRAFLHEGLRMKEFNHPHVMSLIGISWSPTHTPLVILPFMPNGDLLTHLRNPNVQPTLGNLLDWGKEIASAMQYLASLKFVHRDLAARNCMLDDQYHAIVSDFGLSRDIYEKDYYSSSNKNIKLPIKWMALESLQKNVYNCKTDVWSFGIVLWELMTRGVNPYPDVDNWDIINYLVSGRRLIQPLYCPDALYRIMLSCWSKNSDDRPDFSELFTLTENVINELAQERKNTVYEYDTVFYYNNRTMTNNFADPDESHKLKNHLNDRRDKTLTDLKNGQIAHLTDTVERNLGENFQKNRPNKNEDEISIYSGTYLN
ncbi:unnamed protein product [Gordionus sp. m RMFG-2023]